MGEGMQKLIKMAESELGENVRINGRQVVVPGEKTLFLRLQYTIAYDW